MNQCVLIFPGSQGGWQDLGRYLPHFAKRILEPKEILGLANHIMKDIGRESSEF